MEQISICFLGTGSTNRRYIRLVKTILPKAVLSVASRDLARALEFKRKFDLRDAFGSYHQAIQSAYTTMVVGVPPRMHLQLTQFIIEQGKNGLIEKPIFQSLDEFRSIWDQLEKSDSVLMVAENLFFAPFQHKIKKILQSLDMGVPLFFDLNRPGQTHPKGWRIDPIEMPWGALHEGGVHWIRKLLDLTALYADNPDDDILGVRAFAPKPMTKTPHEDTTLVIARHRSGLVSRLFHSWAIPWRMPLFEVSKLVFDRSTLFFDARSMFGRLYGKKRKMLWPSVRDAAGYRHMWTHFINCIQHAEKPKLSMRTIYNDFAYLDAAYRSLKSGREEHPKGITEP